MAKGNTVEIIQMARELGTLEERRKQLLEQVKQTDERIRTLRIRLEGAPPQNSRGARGELIDTLLQQLISNPDRDFSAEELATAIGKAPSSVRGALARLSKEGRISKPRRGVYRARAEA